MLEDWRVEGGVDGWRVVRGGAEIREVEVRLRRRVRVRVDEGSRLLFRRTVDDPRRWTWNLSADNRVIIQAGTMLMDDVSVTPKELVEHAGFSEWMRD